MDSFEDRSVLVRTQTLNKKTNKRNLAYTSNVSWRRKAETTNKSCTHVRENVAVQVRHHHNTVRIRPRIRYYLEAYSIQEIFIICDIGKFFWNFSACRQEHAIRHFPSKQDKFDGRISNLRSNLHDVGLMHRGNPLSSTWLGVMECISSNTLRGIPCNELDGLYDTIDDLDMISEPAWCTALWSWRHLMFDSWVFALGILADKDGVHVIVRSLEALDRNAGSYVGKKIECSSKSEVQRNMALSD